MDKHELLLILPEIIIASMAGIILLVDAFWPKPKGLLPYYLSIVTLMGTIIALAYNYNMNRVEIFSGSFIVDGFSAILKVTLCILAIITFIYSRDYLKEKDLINGEYFTLSLFSILGGMVLVSSGNFLTLYLGLELLALPIYALLAFYKANSKCAEASMKYFIMGALGSGLLLYGISLLYGVTGTLEFGAVTFNMLADNSSIMMALYFAMAFIIAGVGFKLGVVPFQMWVPDVYEGAITSLALFIGTVTKIGAFALAYRVFADVILRLSMEWQSLLLLMGIASIALGSIVGIAQTNIKRMLAYSTIAHFGFVILGFSVAAETGFVTVTFYTVAYVIMLLGAFGVILAISYKGFEGELIKDFRGLAFNSPWLALVMALFMLSMAGIPPTVGFYAKFLVLKDLFTAGHTWIAVAALVFSVMAAFYYLRIIKVMFFLKPKDLTVNYQEILKAWPGSILLRANGAIILLLGVFPGPVIYMYEQALMHSL